MTAVKDVLAMTRVPTADLGALGAEKKELLHHHGQLLGVERHLRQRIESRVVEIDNEARALLGAHDGRETPLPIVDLSVLGWRHTRQKRGEIPVPRLALIDVRGSAMTVPFPAGSRCPERIMDYYVDVSDACRNRQSGRRTNVRISYEYRGAIPSESREMIRAELANFDHVLLLADAPFEAWDYHENLKPRPARTVHRDPLIVGWRNEALYLLGQFDPTPIERYIELEFTARPALTSGKKN